MQPEPGGSLDGVSETALGAAEMRAEETRRPDRLIDDPYAAAFVAAAPPLFPNLPSIDDDPELAALKDEFVTGMAIRTRFYDDFVANAAAAGSRQLVFLGAGLDTRAFRLDWAPNVHVYEVDLPNLFTFKEAVLRREQATARCARTLVAVDLREDWPAALEHAGFDPVLPSTWTAEGLLTYLSNDDAVRLLTNVGSLSAPGSRFACEHDELAAGSTTSTLRTMPGMQEVASMWEGGLTDAVDGWLREHGWRVTTTDRATLARTYRRALRDTAGGFVAATRT